MTQIIKICCALLLSILLLGCQDDTAQTDQDLTSGGLPESQRPQGDHPAGVKFGQSEPFKSLSDTDE